MPDAVGTIHTITDLSNNKYDIHGVLYGVCETSQYTGIKAVTIPGITALTEGLSIRVKFVHPQLYNGIPSLNLNNLGAYVIRQESSTVTNSDCGGEWTAGEIIDLLFDGTKWVFVDGGKATVNSRGLAKYETSATSINEDFAATPLSINNLAKDMISGALVYSSSSTYSVGDRVRYGYKTWECVTDISTPEEWNATHWQALDPLQTQIDNMASSNCVTWTVDNITLKKNPVSGEGWVWYYEEE